jgi:hypothetical protein
VSESALTSRINAARKAVGDSGKDQRIIRTSRSLQPIRKDLVIRFCRP